MKVLIINGAPQSGKDTFIDFINEEPNHGANVYAYSSIDCIKEAAKKIGWDERKDTRGRKFLSDLKDALTAYNDTPFWEVVRHGMLANENNYEFFCVCAREPAEIQKLVEYYEKACIDCHAVLIKNDKAEEDAMKNQTNHADRNYMNFVYHFIINNNSTLDVFQRNVRNFLYLLNQRKAA